MSAYSSLKRHQETRSYNFNLDDLVPKDHLLRQIDRVLDFGELREHLKPLHEKAGKGDEQTNESDANLSRKAAIGPRFKSTPR